MSGKRSSSKMDNALGDVVSIDDEEIRDEVKDLAMEVLSGIRKAFRKGNPSERLAIGRAFLPLLVKSIQKDEENEEIADLKKQMEDMKEAVIGSSPKKLTILPGGEVQVQEDTPS